MLSKAKDPFSNEVHVFLSFSDKSTCYNDGRAPESATLYETYEACCELSLMDVNACQANKPCPQLTNKRQCKQNDSCEWNDVTSICSSTAIQTTVQPTNQLTTITRTPTSKPTNKLTTSPTAVPPCGFTCPEGVAQGEKVEALNCVGYFTCTNGEPSKWTLCDNGLVFDAGIQNCNWAWATGTYVFVLY